MASKVWLVIYANDYVVGAFSTEKKATIWAQEADAKLDLRPYSLFDTMELEVDKWVGDHPDMVWT